MAGRWILPGLIEMHAHGVTTLANLAAAPATGLEAKARLANHALEGPRMFTAGRAMNGPSWLNGFQLVVRVDSERELREEVRRRASSGVDFIKAPHPATASWTAAGFESARSAWLDRDPLEDVANVRSVVAVFQGGRRVEDR